MKAACMNSIQNPEWANGRSIARNLRCGWKGEVNSLEDPCPRCCHRGMLAPMVDVPKMEPRKEAANG